MGRARKASTAEAASRRALPEGTVTFLFSDVEGSTQLVDRFADRMGNALAVHHGVFERIVAEHQGVIFETVGDAVYAAFADAPDAAAAAVQAQRALAETDWGPIGRIACRLALHTGAVERRGDHYFGSALFRCARLQSLGYGEQTLLTDVTATLVRDALPEGVSLRDLGRHRLKDLNEPEHVFMLVHPDLRAEFPPPLSVDLHPNNLPTQLTGLIGRDEDITRVSDLVAEHRLVTLLGPGGVGKTRLALATAANLIDRFADGVFFVDLAPYREADDVALATATTLGVRATPLSPTSEALVTWLARRTILLVLDNVEQIPRVGRALLHLVEAGQGVRLLVTSRSPVRVRGEERFEVEPLAADGGLTPDGVPSFAVQLFALRARQLIGRDARDDELPIIAAICRRVDGLPLGIELAAARTNVYEPSQILARLERTLPMLVAETDDLPARQHTLRATIAWSHDLLSPDQQMLLAASAVFQGAWTMDAWEAVCAATPEAASTLVHAGLVRRRDGRFGMLDTIREFASERLAAFTSDEQEALRDRHADWYGAWAADPDFGEPHLQVEEVERLRVIDAERANLSAACDRLATRDDRSLLRAVVLRLWLYWLTNGLLREGERWTNASLQGSAEPGPEDAAWITAVLGEFPRFSGDLPRALELKHRAIALAQAVGDIRGEAASHADIASVYGTLGDHTRSVASAQRALDLRREVGAAGGMWHALQAVAEAHLRAGNLEAAREANDEALALGFDETARRVFAMTMEAEIARRMGDLRSAAGSATEALRMAVDPLDLLATSNTLRAAGAVLVELADHRSAALVLAAADRIEAECGLVPWMPDVLADANRRIDEAVDAPERETIRADADTMSQREVLQRAIEALERHPGAPGP